MKSIKFELCNAALLIGLIATATSAHAEIGYKIPNGFGWRQGIPLHLLENASVQKDLGLSAEAAVKLAKWKQAIVAAMKSQIPKELDPSKRAEMVGTVHARYQSQLDEILTADQQTRLHEIHLQMAGMDALSDAAVAKALNMSLEQQQRIYNVHDRMWTEEFRSIKGGRFTPTLSMADRDALLLAVLSPDQKRMFEKLRGKPFGASGRLPTLP